MPIYKVIGLMSGSSLDGLDIAYCHIEEKKGAWDFKILKSKCEPYERKWKLRLRNLVLQNAITFIKTHTYYGHYIGEKVKAFIEEEQLQDKVDFIASHGQTIFHQPENRLTSQIGDGDAISAVCGLPVVFNFRSMDVAMGGQGAPIAPIADRLLFHKYRFCLNLGGFCNISFKKDDKKIIAFDICGVNLILNMLANEAGMDYDKNGELAKSGSVNSALLYELNSSWYYKKEYPKSLGGGWINKVILPILSKQSLSNIDLLATYCEHIAMQISKDINHIYDVEQATKEKNDKMLVTGGGAFNTYLTEKIKEYVPVEMVLPSNEIIEYKEALLMALMGVLRIRNEVNCLASVTGASKDTIGGVICKGNNKIHDF